MCVNFSTLGFSQVCFTDTDCAGNSFPVATARECCAETDEGMSFMDEAGTCTFQTCIGS